MMNLRVLLLTGVLGIGMALGGCGSSPSDGTTGVTAPPAPAAPAPAAPAPAGSAPSRAAARPAAPPLSVTAFDGRTVTLGAFRGRPVVVNFFESWWLQCQAEQPGLGRVARDYAGRVEFVGVSNHDTVAAGREYQRRFAVPYPLANDASGRTWAAWKVPYQPVTVVVDRDGRVARRVDGEIHESQLHGILDELLAE
jgi:peroxiredoxin